jgi:adenine-specific DNA methylase
MTNKKFIEESLPLPAINDASDTDKRTHDGHISTMHTWWARRPLPMARAVVAASLIDHGDDADEVENQIRLAMTAKSVLQNPGITWLRDHIRGTPPRSPKVLDCFAGGGAIPLEALRLGCDTTAMDLNPVAHLVELACLDYPQRYGTHDEAGRNTLAADVERWADRVAERTRRAVDHLYPRVGNRERPAPYYFWVRTMPSPDPNQPAEIPILSSRLLAAARRNAWVTTTASPGGIDIDVHQGTLLPDDPTLTEGFESAGSVTCPLSGITAPQSEVKQHGRDRGFGYRLYAVCDVDGRDRTYRAPTPAEVEGPLLARAKVAALEEAEFDDGTPRLPDETVDEIGYNNLQFLPYGYRTWRSLFTDRQLVLYATLTAAIRDAHKEMLAEGMAADRARAVATYLAFALDKVADRNSAFSSWQTSSEKIRGTFPGQTVQMRWDFCENYPFRNGSGSWNDAVNAICKVIEHCAETGDGPARVLRGDAQAMPFNDGEFDAVLIDPPYYYSVMYSDLSDFFYVWLKRSVGHLHPEHFVTPWTPKAQEVVQNRCRPGMSGHITEEGFDRRLGNALSEVARVVKPDGVVAIVFAHTDVKAWEKLLRALRGAGLGVTTSWPIRSEMAGRPVAHVKAALRSSVVLVCRPLREAGDAFFDEVEAELNRVVHERLDSFEHMGLRGADYFVSAVGPAFEVFARHRSVTRLDGSDVSVGDLMELARKTVARHAMGRLLSAEALGILDDHSLLFVSWRWAYLTVPVPDDEAIKLSRAFSVGLDEALAAGMIDRSGKKFSLLGPHQRRGLRIRPDSPIIDVLHRAAQLWDAGRPADVIELLATSGYSDAPGFWDLARVLGELLPEGERERTMYQSLTTSQEHLSRRAAQHSAGAFEEMALFST